MKRITAWALLLVLLLCGCQASSSEENGTKTPVTGAGTLGTLPPTIPVVVPIGERTENGVNVTIHAGLLGNNSEVLSQTQIDDGFTEAVRNEDGSVTYTIAADRYDAFAARCREEAYKSIMYTAQSGNYVSLETVECAQDLSSITLHVIREYYAESMDGLMVFGTGLIAVTAQAYDLEAPGTCVITVVDEHGVVISETVYPDELIL